MLQYVAVCCSMYCNILQLLSLPRVHLCPAPTVAAGARMDIFTCLYICIYICMYIYRTYRVERGSPRAAGTMAAGARIYICT